MGIYVRTEESQRAAMDELRRVLVACSDMSRRKDEEGMKEIRNPSKPFSFNLEEEKVVCVTSGVSFLGVAIINQLLLRGYSVRIIVDNPEDIEKLKEMKSRGEMRSSNDNGVSAVMAKLTEIDSLVEAFEGCRGVFHTSAFVDPAGISGYSRSIGEIEVSAAENVVEACARTSSLRSCVLTSSLLACIWRDHTKGELSTLVDHQTWSHESICIQRKLWYALAKMRAEKAAWKLANERGIKLSTICPGLITGQDYLNRNPTPTIAYLKGAQEMYENGLLAAVDVARLAKAHVMVFEAMRENTFGRYLCFDHIVSTQNDAEKLAKETNMSANKISQNSTENSRTKFQLSNTKLLGIMSGNLRSCYSENQLPI